jgi:hypothetical protein
MSGETDFRVAKPTDRVAASPLSDNVHMTVRFEQLNDVLDTRLGVQVCTRAGERERESRPFTVDVCEG